MEISLAQIKTEYGEKIVISASNQVKYADFTSLKGAEMALYELLESTDADNLQSVLQKNPSWDCIYNLSDQRSNVISWLPMDERTKILEIGAECGAVTGKLCSLAGHVDSIEADLGKCIINLKRNESFSNLTVYSGKATEFEPELPRDYDYIIVFVPNCTCANRNELAEMLEKLKQHLINDGRLVLVLDNRLGLKFFSGAAAEQENAYFTGITGFRSGGIEKAYSREAIETVLCKAGFNDYSFYYPYPDYRFMHTLYSDQRLPNVGELTDNRKNLEGNRMALFDEKNAFDSIIEDGCFGRFANSFLVISEKRPEVIYAKFSAERDRSSAMLTTIERRHESEASEETTVIKKRALFEEGKSHILNMEKNYIRLCDKYSKTDLRINRCLGIDESGLSAFFEYVEGISLSEVLDRFIKANDVAGFKAVLQRYIGYVQGNWDEKPYDRDMIFDNILVNGDEWTLIDYEWCSDEPYDCLDVIYRSLHTYLVGDKKRNIFNYDLIYDEIGVTPDQGAVICSREAEFQQQIKGKCISLSDLNTLLNNPVFEPVKNGTDDRFRFQIYRCDAKGAFSEERSFFYENAYGFGNSSNITIDITDSDRIIRLDPVNTSCLVRINSVCMDDTVLPVNRRTVFSNGKYVEPAAFIFDTEDPNLVIKLGQYLTPGFTGTLKVSMDIYPMPSGLMSELAARIKLF